MTTVEMSDTFDTMLNSYAAKRNFGDQNSPVSIELDEYEKSVFLTQAQEEVVIGLYSGRNPIGVGFENTEELRRSLDFLVKQHIYTDEDEEQNLVGLSSGSVFYKLPDDLLFITLEQIKWKDPNLVCYDGRYANVLPITQDEYSRVRRNPYRGPTKYKALRLDPGNHMVELISKFHIGEYLIRYLSKPEPIVLVDLPEGTSIDGYNTVNECKLNVLLHNMILERAVQIAYSTKTNNKANV